MPPKVLYVSTFDHLVGSWIFVVFLQLFLADAIRKIVTLGKFNKSHPSQVKTLDGQTESVKYLRRHLHESLGLRVLNVPLPSGSLGGNHVRVAVLFSGGLDCTVLARMTHNILPLDQPVDLINVAFENPRVLKAAKDFAKDLTKTNSKDGKKNPQTGDGCGDYSSSGIENQYQQEQSPFESCPDRKTGRKALEELQRVCSGRCWRFVAVSTSFTNKFIN